MENVVVSRHAKKRLKRRVHKSWQKAANLAFYHGVRHRDTCGRLRKYIDRLVLTRHHPGAVRSCIVYNEHVYLFDPRNVLITVLHLPSNLAGTGRRLTRRKQRQPSPG